MHVTGCSLTLEFGDDGAATLSSAAWPVLRVASLRPEITTDGAGLPVTGSTVGREAGGQTVSLVTQFGANVELRQEFAVDADVVRVVSVLANRSAEPFVLTSVRLLASPGVRLAGAVGALRVYEQGAYWARVRTAAESEPALPRAGREDAPEASGASSSEYVWVGYDSGSRMALLAGFETGERWIGMIGTEPGGAAGEVRWSAGFDGGDLLVQPGEALVLEDLVLMCGPDPLALLARYGDRVAARHGLSPLAGPPVTWCSWYPYRLGVTAERVLQNAEVAAQRLRPLGLDAMLVDLGWQTGYLPSSFEPNDQFPGGLAALACGLAERGFRLGAWTAPFVVSEFDPLAREHPGWLARGPSGEPVSLGDWYWEPHGRTFALDLSHPDAVAHVRGRVAELARQGVRYLKPDFMGSAMHAALKARYDRRVVTGGGAEAIRRGMAVMLEALREGSPDALALNCGGAEIPGRGALPLLYTCNDTGNTGYVGWRHLKEDYGRNVAGHLWKNGRWGCVQPSCMVVGLPGTLEEARARATATFMAGGQVDIGDDLTTLPEDRWRVLLATLPPLGRSATPIDLFDPIATCSFDYDAQARGGAGDRGGAEAPDASCVWTLDVDGGWDRWLLVALFSYDGDETAPYGKARITRYDLPLARLGLERGLAYWAHEFWSGQFLGASPFRPPAVAGYRHPGDAQSLVEAVGEDAWRVSFFGPCAKLLVVREARPHPWVVATTFHQSGGRELRGVAWDGSTLRGVLCRPAGERGDIVVAGARGGVPTALVSDRAVPTVPGACGSVVVPVVTTGQETRWSLQWA